VQDRVAVSVPCGSGWSFRVICRRLAVVSVSGQSRLGAAGTSGRRVLTAGVALAFADASIVVLALPSIYARFGSTIVGVSWVLTGYAVAVTVAATLIALVRRRLPDRPVPLTAAGAVLFGAGSAWCGAAGSLPSLLAGRVAQGVGAAGLLSGALAVLCAEVGRDRGRRLGSGAATAGLAVGPALGGALTEAFSWRVIFFGQVPVALLVLAALIRAPRGVPAPPATDEGGTRRAVWANLGYLTLFAGLVGALFLGVLLLVEVWGFAPLLAAVVMTALPAGTLLARTPNLLAGVGALSAGLVALALLPATNPAWAAVALFVCGAGAGMVMKALGGAAVPAAARPVRAGGAVVAAKHAGLVLGLVVIAPLLSGSLQHGGEQAVLAGTGVLLDARMPAQDKLHLAVSVRDSLADTPRGAVPDVSKAIGDTALADQVDTRLRAVLTRSFRPAFAAAAVLAFLTLAAGFGLRRRHSAAIRPHPGAARRAVAVPATVSLLAVGIIGAEVAAGTGQYGRYAESQPCSAPADPYPGSDVDALVQRVAYGALNGAACELGLSRERFVLALAGQPGFATVRWDSPAVERAVRAGVERAVDDADRRDDLPGWVAALVRETVTRMPIGKMLELLGLTGK
jgi:predicted MFS family arabinose efflux permease